MTPERWEQIKRLFHESLAHEPPQRSAFLTGVCGEDVSLRREIETLLEAHEQADDFIETPACDIAASLLAEEQSGVAPGEIVGPFTITKALATGGMGQVYLAEDTRLSRSVALKLLPPQFTVDRDRVRRFEQEARAASALNHPNIVTIHEIGQTDALHYIATEFVDGKTLREHLRNTRMTVGEVIDVAWQIASALQAAHYAGIVHRDIKPENVMLRRDRIVKVLDFGLAKLAPIEQHPTIKSTVNTNPGVVMGTVAYMSPEQARGNEVDRRTDIWSLGVVLYEMVARRAPFKGDTPSHVIVSILENKQPPLSVDSGVPAGLERIISKSLRKDPVERYQTASEMALDLKNLKEDLTIETRLKHLQGSPDRDEKINGQAKFDTGEAAAASTSELFGTLFGTYSMSSAEYFLNAIKRHRGSAAFASVAGLLVMASLVYFTNFTRGRSEAIDSVAVLIYSQPAIQSFVVSGDPNGKPFADWISATITRPLSRLPDVKVIPVISPNPDNFSGKQWDALAIGRELNVSAVLVVQIKVESYDEKRLGIDAELSDVKNNRRMWGAMYRSKPALISIMLKNCAEDIAEELYLGLGRPEKEGPTIQHTVSADAYRAYLNGRYLNSTRRPNAIPKSIRHFEEAIKIDPSFALAYASLANAHVSLAKTRLHDPNVALPQAKAAVTKALAIDDTLAEAHAALANIRLYEWNWAGAESEFKRAKELNSNYDRIDAGYEDYLLSMKRLDEAVAEVLNVSSHGNSELARHLYLARRYDEAIEQSQKTLDSHPDGNSVYVWLAASYEQKKLYDLCVDARLKWLEVSGASFAEVESLREAYSKSGWEGYWRKVLDSSKEGAKKGIDNPHLLAGIYTRLGAKDQAFACLERAYEQRISEMKFLNTDPLWDALRSDPRYTNLVRRMGLEP